MGFFGIGGDSASTSNQTDQTQTTSGASSPVTGTAGGKSPVNTGTQLTLGKDATVTTSDPLVVNSALSTVKDIFQGTVNTIEKSVASTNDLARSALTANPQVQAAAATTDWTSIAKWFGIGLLAVAGVFLITRKK